MTDFDFGPKTPEEKEIFKYEYARVDREVAEYEQSLTGQYAKFKARYHEALIEPIEKWFYFRFRGIKFFYQRLTQGFDDSATWSLDTHLARIIAPRLKRYKELNTHAWPGPVEGMPGTGRFNTFQEWHQALDKMIFAFESYASEDRDFWDWSESERDRIEEGLMLFAKHYGALWD
jgi:hypothetical protein